MTITPHTLFVADCFEEGLAYGDTDIFYGVMCIDMQITFGFDFEVDQSMTRDLIEHVIQKSNSGGQLRSSATIQIEFNLDLRLQSIACDLCFAHHE